MNSTRTPKTNQLIRALAAFGFLAGVLAMFLDGFTFFDADASIVWGLIVSSMAGLGWPTIRNMNEERWRQASSSSSSAGPPRKKKA